MSWINATPQVLPSGAVFEKSSAAAPCVRHAFANTTISQRGKAFERGIGFNNFDTRVVGNALCICGNEKRYVVGGNEKCIEPRADFPRKALDTGEIPAQKFPLIRNFVIDSSKIHRNTLCVRFYRRIAARNIIPPRAPNFSVRKDCHEYSNLFSDRVKIHMRWYPKSASPT